MTYTYSYPMPSVTVDCVIICCGQILLIRRRDDPFKDCWALPGGFVNIDERISDACFREVKEETGITLDTIVPVGVYDQPDRDPRGRVIDHAFSTIIRLVKAGELKAGDDAAEAMFYELNELPPLAFDHAQIIQDAVAQRKQAK